MAIVIGCGNPLRGDDAVGAAVADRLRRESPEVEVVTIHQLVPELADAVASADFVVFVDAAVGEAPGEIRCDPIRHADTDSSVVDHAMSPTALLRLARDLHGCEPPAWMVRVTASGFDFGAPLSRPVSAAVPRAVQMIRQIVPSRH